LSTADEQRGKPCTQRAKIKEDWAEETKGKTGGKNRRTGKRKKEERETQNHRTERET
jgi:hypothetical protein